MGRFTLDVGWFCTPLWVLASSEYALKPFLIFCSGEVDRRIAFGQLKRFAWRELQIATDNFNEKNVLGQGGFGKVYKGVLSDNTKVAVKRLTDYESPGGDAAFQREVEMISVAVHRNLLRLIGFCTTPTERLLVYPFMQNLSVAYRLRGIVQFIRVSSSTYHLHLCMAIIAHICYAI